MQVSNVTDSIENGDILQVFRPALRRSIEVKSGEPSYSDAIPDIEILEKLLASASKYDFGFSHMLKRQNPLKYKATFEVREGTPRLDSLAREFDGRQIPDFGGSKIYAEERVEVRLHVRRAIYEQKRPLLKAAAAKIWRDHQVQVHIDENLAEKGGISDSSKSVEIFLRTTNRKGLLSARAAIDGVVMKDMCGPLSTPAPRPPQQTHRIRLTKTKAYRDALKVYNRQSTSWDKTL